MSRASGRQFAGFFPQAPSVVQEKKRLAREGQRRPADSPNHPGASITHNAADEQDSRGQGEDKDDGTELLNIGSASSNNSAHSSVFSNAVVVPHAGSVELTPASDKSSPPDNLRSPKNENLAKHMNASGLEYSPLSPRSRAATPIAKSTSKRQVARPGKGVVKGQRLVFDPETDVKASKELRKRGVQYRDFGKEESPSSDPRLAIPGYRSGSFNVRPPPNSGTWKFRPRPAPYSIAPYPWDPALSVGPGPPTSVVVTGFDPFTSDVQLRALFSSYGEIAEIDNKTDPNTGTFLGVCLVRYRDSRGRGTSIAAVAAARRAEKEATGQRVGQSSVRVERDRSGKKCKKYADSIIRRNQEHRERELAKEAALRPVVKQPPPPPVEIIAATAAPPPNAPKGPRPAPPKAVAMLSLIEQEPVLSKIKRKPYIFLSQQHVPVMGTTIPHLKKRLKTHRWEEIRCDETGYYIVFEDHKRGEDEAARCFREYNGRELFTYTMTMECQQYGNPQYERTPSPERVLEETRQREEEERIRKEDEMDIEEEKKQRAADLDPVIAAMEFLWVELRDKIMADIKSRIGAPALHDFLDPARHVAKRRKLGIADPSEQSRPAFLPFNETKPLRPHASVARLRENRSNVFLEERRHSQKKPKRKVDVRPLHQRLQDFYEDDSDDDRTATRATDDVESRPHSRLGSVVDRDSTPGTPKHRLRSETPHEDSDMEGLGEAKSLIDPKLFIKDSEEMSVEELNLIVQKLPQTAKLFKRARDELLARQQAREDDKLFIDSTDDGPLVEDAGIVTDFLVADIIDAKKSKKSKKKSKKQIFEEREAAKALLGIVDIPDVVPEPEDEYLEEEEERAEVEWGVSTERPRRTVEDDPYQILDVEGWQHLVKDAEDLVFLRQALVDVQPAVLADVNAWAYEQKSIKALNNGYTHINGYYVPNTTGAARTEGFKKIVESEKSKYLPHRIKVAEARKRRQEEEPDNSVVAVEAARQAKAASTAISRTTRANNRTQIKDIVIAKQHLASEGGQSDAIRFNQLKKRKKLVKFDRSAIHGWGLYAEENIAASDMIIEYVGEKVRQAVANIRELRYDKQGMGSSYLFRIDDDTVVDATKKGGIARFINHSCAPNCTAKIVKVEDEHRIAIYAKIEIKKGDELTYDYKFEREMDSDMRVPCLCGSDVCKGFLN